ncbi:GIY-YIG nuclease family protein [Candidatus Microgenomates bacterium]|nr:GIY-YIG nuclease family protein [Candidatus Microgenomates bacterium]
MYYTYILKSSKSLTFYYGSTSDLKKRVQEHNSGVSKSTKPYIPWTLALYCGFPTKRQAEDFELYLKSGSGKAFAYKRLVVLAKDEFRRLKGCPKP